MLSKKYQKQHISEMVLLITTGCNLKCDYCYLKFAEPQDPPKTMSKEIAFESVRFLLDELKGSGEKRGVIAFLGGEPLLNWELIKETVEYAEEKSKKNRKKIAFTITTNGLLLDKKKIAYMRKHGFSILLSLDSHKAKIHDKLRPTRSGGRSFGKISNNLKTIRKWDELSITATVTKNNLELFEYLQYFSRVKAVSSIELGHIVTRNKKDWLSPGEVKRYKAELEKYADYIIGNWKKGKLIKPHNGYLDLISLLQDKNKFCQPGYCSGGRESIAVATSGGIYACASVSDIPEFYLGDIFFGIDEFLRKKLLGKLESAASNKECRKCPLNSICGGCFAATYIMEKRVKRSNKACEFIKIDFAIAQRLLDKINELSLRV